MDLIGSAKKKKLIEREQSPSKHENVFPMKPQIIRNNFDNRADLFFDFHNRKAVDSLNKQMDSLAIKRAREMPNSDLQYKQYHKQPTPNFIGSEESSDEELPFPPEHQEAEEDDEIDMLVRQVIFENHDDKDAFTRDPNIDGIYVSPTFNRDSY